MSYFRSCQKTSPLVNDKAGESSGGRGQGEKLTTFLLRGMMTRCNDIGSIATVNKAPIFKIQNSQTYIFRRENLPAPQMLWAGLC